MHFASSNPKYELMAGLVVFSYFLGVAYLLPITMDLLMGGELPSYIDASPTIISFCILIVCIASIFALQALSMRFESATKKIKKQILITPIGWEVGVIALMATINLLLFLYQNPQMKSWRYSDVPVSQTLTPGLIVYMLTPVICKIALFFILFFRRENNHVIYFLQAVLILSALYQSMNGIFGALFFCIGALAICAVRFISPSTTTL